MRIQHAAGMSGTMLVMLLLASVTAGVNAGVMADTPEEAHVSSDVFTVTKAEFENSDTTADTAACMNAPVPSDWCKDTVEWGEEFDPLGLDGSKFDQWLESVLMEFVYQVLVASMAVTEVVVNIIAPAAYAMKTVIGEQATIWVGRIIAYSGVFGLLAYHVSRAVSATKGVAS